MKRVHRVEMIVFGMEARNGQQIWALDQTARGCAAVTRVEEMLAIDKRHQQETPVGEMAEMGGCDWLVTFYAEAVR